MSADRRKCILHRVEGLIEGFSSVGNEDLQNLDKFTHMNYITKCNGKIPGGITL